MAVETGDEKHQHFGAHAEEQHEVGTLDVRQFEKCTEDDDGGTPAVEVVQDGLTLFGLQKILETGDYAFLFSLHDLIANDD